ncbi:MAG TPA: hypothetical protein ENG42_02480 [Candidatus Aenigmarchaeota archaeon]|nr:MAG: hypothetical protein DRP03_03820 [Candidatus Aenigmarchaeota archaeon]HDD46315.1 hypothetical protein [Candidatus Aenigmarchaeota archaeon]
MSFDEETERYLFHRMGIREEMEYSRMYERETKGRLSQADIDLIVHTYYECNGNIYEMLKRLPFSKSTIKKYLRMHGLRGNGRPRRRKRLSKEEIEMIKMAKNVYGGNVERTARHLPYSIDTIRKYWRNY